MQYIHQWISFHLYFWDKYCFDDMNALLSIYMINPKKLQTETQSRVHTRYVYFLEFAQHNGQTAKIMKYFHTLF